MKAGNLAVQMEFVKAVMKEPHWVALKGAP
jgi:hypothetical protein